MRLGGCFAREMGRDGWASAGIRPTFSCSAAGNGALLLVAILAAAGCGTSGDNPFSNKSSGGAEDFGGLGDEVSFDVYRFCPPKSFPRREVPSPAPGVKFGIWSKFPAEKPGPGVTLICSPHHIDVTKQAPDWDTRIQNGMNNMKRKFQDFQQLAGNRTQINGLEAFRCGFKGTANKSDPVVGVITVFMDDINIVICVVCSFGRNAEKEVAVMEESSLTVQRPGYEPPEGAFWDPPPGAKPEQPINKVHLEMIRAHGLDKIALVSVVDLPFGVTPSQKRHISKVIRETVGAEALSFGNIGPDDFVVVVAPVEDVAKLAGDLDLGQVTSIDRASRSFTLHMDSDKLPSFMELAKKEAGVAAADVGHMRDMSSGTAAVTSPDDPDFFKQNLADLRVGDVFRRKKALERLVGVDTSKLADPEMRSDIAKAIRVIAFDSSVMPQTRSTAVEGLVHWGGKFAGPLLVQLLAEDDPFVKDEIYSQLAIVKEPTAIDPLITKITQGGLDAEDAANCLAAFGPAAEDAVLAGTRAEGLRTTQVIVHLLGRIGTKKSLPALKSLRKSASIALSRKTSNLPSG